jgi:hypothetical protein
MTKALSSMLTKRITLRWVLGMIRAQTKGSSGSSSIRVGLTWGAVLKGSSSVAGLGWGSKMRLRESF